MEPRETGLLGTLPIVSKGYCNSERVAEGDRPQEWWRMGFGVQGLERKRLIRHNFDMCSMKTPGRKELVTLAAQTLREEVRCHSVTF